MEKLFPTPNNKAQIGVLGVLGSGSGTYACMHACMDVRTHACIAWNSWHVQSLVVCGFGGRE